MDVQMPISKVVELVSKISKMLLKKKTNLKSMQSLIGSLNFACKVVSPGRTFCRSTAYQGLLQRLMRQFITFTDGQISQAFSLCGHAPNTCAGLVMDGLQSECRRLMQCNLSINTKLAYQTAFQQFTTFRRFLKLPDLWPVPIDHLFHKGLSPSTVSSYLVAISHIHKVYNWTNPTSQFLVQKAVTGLGRIRQVRDSRAPVTEDMLHNIYHILETVCWSEYELWLFRASELVYTTVDMAHRPLFYSEIKVSTSGSKVGLLVKIRFSKTDPQGRSITLRIPVITGKSVCPVFIRNRSDGILFIHEDGSPLTRYQFNAVLRKSIIKLGLPVSVFSSHSFRIRAATTLALKGLDPSIIQSLGRWRSDAFSKYIRLDKLYVFTKHNYSVSMFGYWAHLLFIWHAEWQIDSCRVIYFGKRGMIWEDVLLTVSHKLTYLPPPKVLLLHVGANNIPSTNTGILCNRIKQDIHKLAIWMPDSFVIWLDLICRLNWRGEISIQTLERKRKRINRMGRGVSITAGESFFTSSGCCGQLLCQSPAKLDPRGRNVAMDVSWE
ncbi:hypothetical protein KUTeg_007224, partial [Tegillarca granosa]